MLPLLSLPATLNPRIYKLCSFSILLRLFEEIRDDGSNMADKKCKNIVGFAWKLLRGGSNSKRVKRDENRGCDCTCKYLRHSNTVIIKAERCCIWIGIINPISDTKYRSVGSSEERYENASNSDRMIFATIVSSSVPSIIILHIFLSIIIPWRCDF